jgi:molecular chaperone DnaK (HSP70)
MSVVGIDFGNDTCYISVARQGGIETIANDYSLRSTPSYVAFGEKARTMGVAAKSAQNTQARRTFYGFKKLLGRKVGDPRVTEEMARVPFELTQGEGGRVVYALNYGGKDVQLTSEQITASLFTKLKEIGENALGTKVNDVVISCPSYFTDAERRALLDSAKMSGLNVLRLMNDTTATALAYGIYKQDLPETDKPARNVVFVDVGHTGTQVAACSFNKGKLTMLSSSNCQSGGRGFDETICKYFFKDFEERYKLNVPGNKKAVLKLMTEAEKLKKLMASNQNKIPLNIECFMDDKDVKGGMERSCFEELIAGDLAQIEATLNEVLETSKLKLEDIYSVEIVGGSSRIPSIKALIEKVYQKAPSTTLNADEAVSRGCALMCAILSPTFKVREFSVTDIQPYPIKLVWDNQGAVDEKGPGEMEVFPAFHAVPFSKMLTFFKSDTFQVAGEYSSPVPFPDSHIGNFEVGEVRPTAEGGNQKVKVKVRINPNGIFGVASASLVEKHEIEEEVPVEMEVDDKKEDGEKKEGGEEKMEGEEKKEEAAKEGGEDKMETEDAKKKEGDKGEVKMEKRKKTVNKTIELPVSSRVQGQLSFDKLQAATTSETLMAKADRDEAERLNSKNSVEEYIYEIRGKICDELEDFMLEGDRERFSRELTDAEDWLYEDGEFADKKTYTEKLATLRSTGEAVRKRRREHMERPEAINQFGQCMQLAQKAVDSFKAGDEKFNHLDTAEVEKVQKAIAEKQDWFSRMCADVSKLDKTSDPPVLASQFYQEKESFWHMASNILNKQKPKVEPPPPPPAEPAKEEGMETEKQGGANQGSDSKPAASEETPPQKQAEMDVD